MLGELSEPLPAKAPRSSCSPSVQPTRDLLANYYESVLSLRQFLLSRLPSTSKSRRRRLVAYGRSNEQTSAAAHFFDSTIVGVDAKVGPSVEEARDRDFSSFTQSPDRSSLCVSGQSQKSHFEEASTISTRHFL